MPHVYSLEHLTALRCTPPELVYVAARAGYDQVGLRTIPLGLPDEPECEVAHDPVLLRRTRDALAATGLSISDIELVRILPSMDPQSYEPAFAAGAELGATDVTASIWTSEAAYARDMFDEVCAVAKPYGLRLNLEFVAIANVRNLSQAAWILNSVDATNVGMLLDMYHLHRARVELSELDGLPADWFSVCQLCDAPAGIPDSWEDIRQEVRERRLYLGEGAIDVSSILARLPDMVYALEIPNRTRLEELGPEAYARQCLRTARRYFGDG